MVCGPPRRFIFRVHLVRREWEAVPGPRFVSGFVHRLGGIWWAGAGGCGVGGRALVGAAAAGGRVRER